MPGYISKYVPCDFAIARIAEHHCGGDEAAAWTNVRRAIDEGAITTASGNSEKDMLSYIVAGVVKSGTRRDSPERKEPPAGTWLRRELEEIYDPISAEDGESTPPKQPTDKKKSYAGRPSQVTAIENEMRRRAKEGVLCLTLAAEARAMCQWGEKKYPDEQIPKERSMQNAIRSEYWNLRRTHI